MARAKRTDSSEARRRYRAAMLEQGQGDPETRDIEEERPAARTRQGAARPSSAAQVRPNSVGMFAALKLATRPVHYLDDLRYAPTLIFRTNAIWPTVLISVAALAFGLTRTDYNDSSIPILTTFALASPPLIQPMLAGLLAPRATWLAGIISSLISGICLLVLLVWYSSGHLANLPETSKYSPDRYSGLSITVLITAVTFGALLGAGSGWYRRFLGLISGNPTRSSQRSGSQKPRPRRSNPRR